MLMICRKICGKRWPGSDRGYALPAPQGRAWGESPMRKARCISAAFVLALTLLFHGAASLSAADPPGAIVLREGLVLPRLGFHGRSPLRIDPVELAIVRGKWLAPAVGDKVTLPGGKSEVW